MDYKDNIVLYVTSSKHDEQMKLFTENPVSILVDAFVHLLWLFSTSSSPQHRQERVSSIYANQY